MIVITDAAGKPLYWSNNSLEEAQHSLQPGELAVEREMPPDVLNDYYNVNTGTWKTKPTRPTELHVWNWGTYRWNAPNAEMKSQALQAAKDAAKATLSVQRAQIDLSPISVSGVTLDVDETGRANIKGMLDVLSITGVLPEGWSGWRDFDNNFHLANGSAQDVKTFLETAILTIARRTQFLYSQAWAAKEQIDLATTTEEVEIALSNAWIPQQ